MATSKQSPSSVCFGSDAALPRAGSIFDGALAGGLVALLMGGIWIAVMAATDREFALLALFTGSFIARTVRAGAGVRGFRVGVLAVALTYATIVLAPVAYVLGAGLTTLDSATALLFAPLLPLLRVWVAPADGAVALAFLVFALVIAWRTSGPHGTSEP